MDPVENRKTFIATSYLQFLAVDPDSLNPIDSGSTILVFVGNGLKQQHRKITVPVARKDSTVRT